MFFEINIDFCLDRNLIVRIIIIQIVMICIYLFWDVNVLLIVLIIRYIIIIYYVNFDRNLII